jgi:hypothetical protein
MPPVMAGNPRTILRRNKQKIPHTAVKRRSIFNQLKRGDGLMNKKTATPIKTWLAWSIILLGAFLLLTWQYFVAGLNSDASKISHLLLIFFFGGFISSLRSAIYLQKEFASLSTMAENRDVSSAKPSDVARLFSSAKGLLDKRERVDIHKLITTYGMKLGIRLRNVSVIAGMLITIGLLGTVIGLIITVGGLSSVLNAAGNNYEEMIAGMNRTVMGMGTAFYTTFFGGLLGGVVLRVLGSELEKSASQLAAEAMELGELWLAPLCHEHASETLVQLEDQIQALKASLGGLEGGINDVVGLIDAKKDGLHESMSQLVSEAERSIAEALGKGLEELAAGFASITETIEERQQPLKDGLTRLADEVERSISETRHQSDKRMQMRTSDIAQKLNVAAAMIESLCEPDERAA